MGIVNIEKGIDITKVKKKIESIKSIKAFPAKRFMGKLKLSEDPMAYQKRSRKEWNESAH